jgi:hypothetical protein
MNVEIQIPMTQAMLQQFKVPTQVLPSMMKQKLFIPLTGTIDKPQLDQAAIAKRIGEMMVEEVKKIGEKQLLDTLPNLLKGIKP